MRKSITSILILAIIGVIFSVDAVLLYMGIVTFSEKISGWIQASGANLAIFISCVVLLSIHWIFGYYKNK
jgi:hypothetical protein